jgi:hypothetical protein
MVGLSSLARLWLLGLACCAVQCSRGQDGSAGGSEQTSPATTSVRTSSPVVDGGLGLRPGRRPDRSYVLVFGAKQCVVFWEAGDERSEPQVVRCPRELEQGERIHLRGRVCFREGTSRDRDVPVRCPVDLIDRERNDREDAGPT